MGRSLVRRLGWRVWYELLAARIGKPDWGFMNYGYAELDGAPPLELEPADEPDRFCIQLYDRVARAVDLRGKDVLEVGCGRGGGSSYVMRYHSPASMTGVDFSGRAIGFCNRHRALPGLSFVQGNAEALPFDACTFDAVLNVESSHCYGSVDTFLSEVHRVLRPGGHLLFADLRSEDRREELRQQLAACPMTIVEQEEITPNVLLAMSRDSERKVGLIREIVPRALQGYFLQFAGIEGTEVYEAFRSGRQDYMRCVLRKDA